MKITEYFKSLGHTPDEVANSLRAQGIKGKIQSPCFCPILNGLYKSCPNYWSGLKIYGSSTVKGKHTYKATLDDCQITDPILPDPVIQFLGEFDQGKYPDLVSKNVKEVTVRVWE